ncbi:GGDEF domain-containing protein [Aeromicrobium sp. UC242_57]|uniref:GGDEF domain-containing protein n=1 Tax=Aeromicrobium sp. UC242_57 TaxID=3374624 RepID=UPI00379621A0
MVLFLGGSTAYLFADFGQQRWANPVGNSLLVMGAASIWTAARSLVRRQSRTWLILVPPAVAGGAAALGNPGSEPWAGGTAFLLMMTLLFGLTARELWPRRSADAPTQVAMAVAAGIVSGFYTCRLVVFTITGPDGSFFMTYLNGSITLLIDLVLLIAVSFSMSLLSQEQSIRDLRARATRDGLTGLLNRTEFLDLAAQELSSCKARWH